VRKKSDPSNNCSWGTEAGDQRGDEWEPIKISSKFEPSAYIPKTPQTLEPRSVRIAKDKLSQSKRPRFQYRSNARKLLKLRRCWVRPVWPLARTGQTGLAGIWKLRPVRPVSQTGQTGCSQTARKQSFKCQISSKRSPNPTKLGGYLRNYPVNISPRDLSQKINRSREFKGRLKMIGVFSRTQTIQFVRTSDSRGFGTRLDASESSQRVHQSTNSKGCLLQTQNTPKEENSNPKRKGGREGRELSTQGWITNEFHSLISEEFTYTKARAYHTIIHPLDWRD